MLVHNGDVDLEVKYHNAQVDATKKWENASNYYLNQINPMKDIAILTKLIIDGINC